MIHVGKEFLGTPYKGGTLEGAPEKCRIDLLGVDCVTYYEYVLALSRLIKDINVNNSNVSKDPNYDHLFHYVQYLRYRGGILTDYSSRLHYTTDWFYDNAKKNVVKDITKDIGGELFKKKINFMSTHPQYYEALKNNHKMIEKISKIEDEINSRKNYYIPQNKIAEIEKYLQNGDIVGITSSIKGLDYNHTGIIYDDNGVKRLMHASSEKKKVVIGKQISEYVNSIKKHTGISVVRPL
jgi:hypothetical protein